MPTRRVEFISTDTKVSSQMSKMRGGVEATFGQCPKERRFFIPHNLPFGVCPSVEKLDGDETNNLAYRGPLNLVKHVNNSKGT